MGLVFVIVVLLFFEKKIVIQIVWLQLTCSFAASPERNRKELEDSLIRYL